MVLKVNELPNIYAQKRKNKVKKGRYHVHVETTNPSFIKMYSLLDSLGIENNKFFLALYDERLIGVDPHSPSLDSDTKVLVLNECMVNFWYFIREVVRLPVAGSALGKAKKYELNRGNLAINFCIMNNLDSYTELPRQSGKSIAVDIFLLWLYNFGTTNSDVLVMNKEFKDAKENLDRIRNIRNSLPDYLRFDFRLNEEGKKLKPEENKISVYNSRTHNKLTAKPSAVNPSQADNLGRGCTQPVQWFDEFAFLKYNDIIYKAAAPAQGQAAIEARKNKRPNCKIITSTPGDLKYDHGIYASEFISRCALFRESLYDEDVSEIRQYVNANSTENNGNGFLYIKFSYKQIGRSEAWFAEQIKQLDGDMQKVRREVLLQWINDVHDSPFTAEELEGLEAVKRKVKRTIPINKYYLLDMYEDIDLDYMNIIAVDVATGGSKDSSAITIINSRTKRIIATFKSNKINPTDLSSVIYTIAKQLVPNSIIVIERNLGTGVISNLTKSDVAHKLYWQYKRDGSKEKVRNGFIKESNDDVREYGIFTSAANRDEMYGRLVEFVRKYPSRVAVEPLIEEISKLQWTKTGRIDHMPGAHDDLIMSYLVGMYAYYSGDNMSTFGLIRFPDFDETEEEESERLKEYEENTRVQRTRLAYAMTVDDEDDDEFNKELMTNDFKTVRDLYDEIDNEILASRGHSNLHQGANSQNNVNLVNAQVNTGFYRSLYGDGYEFSGPVNLYTEQNNTNNVDDMGGNDLFDDYL